MLTKTKLKYIIKETIKGRRERPGLDTHKKYNLPDIDVENFDWIDFFDKMDVKMKGLNNEYALTSLDSLKNEHKLHFIIKRFNKIKNHALNYAMKFNEYYVNLSDIDRGKYKNVVYLINDFLTKKTKFEQILLKMQNIFEQMGDIDKKYVF